MYQAMYAPHILVSLPSSQHQVSNHVVTSSNGTVMQSPLEGVSTRNFFDQCVSVDMTSTTMSTFHHRNHHSIMPPPPHSFLNNNTTQNNNNSLHKNYNSVKHNRNSYWNTSSNKSQKTVTAEQNGDTARSPTPRGYDSDDSCKSQDCKGLKQLYGTQQALFQQSALHLSGGLFYNCHHSNNNNNNNNRSQNPTLSHINNCTVYQTKRRTPTNNNRNGNRQRRTYQGSSHLIAPDRYLARANEIEVRGEPANLRNGGICDNISMAMWNRFVNNQQTINTYKDKMNLWRSLYMLIKSYYPRYGLFLVGSTISGFGSNSSDMDMCLLVRNTDMDQRCEAVVHLEIVQRVLKQCDFVSNIELIQAKVPILKFRDPKRSLEVDLNCNNSVGIRNTHLLRCYANLDWRVRPLVVIVKLWARYHKINDAKNMTISSYSLALMVIHFLQCGVTPPVIPCLQGIYHNKFNPHLDIHSIEMHEQLLPFQSDNVLTLGELLVGFLGYYALFDYNLYAISVRLGSRIGIEECKRARSAKNDPHQWKHLCIEEPFDLTNTARSVYDPDVFEHIKLVFYESFQRLRDTHDLESIFTDFGLVQPTRVQPQPIQSVQAESGECDIKP